MRNPYPLNLLYLPLYTLTFCLSLRPRLHTDPRNETLHKNSIETLSISTLNLVHRDSTNIPPIPPSSTLAPCENWTQFESLNIHRIFVCRKFYNQKHCTAATNASLVNSDLLLSTICSFSTVANPPKVNTTEKWRQYLDKVHMDILFGECVNLWGHWYALLIVDVSTRYCW